MLAAQQGLNPQQMQQLLQQQLLNPQQLQQVMQQQTLLLQQQQQQKLQEQLLHQLNEQLQMNILQQSQLLQQTQQQQQLAQSPQSVHSQITQSDKNKNHKQVKQRMQELTLQQQQLIQQIQLQQRQYLLSQGIGLVPPFGLPQAMSPAEIQQLWKEVASQSGIDSSVDMKNHLNGVALATSVAQAAAVAAASVTSGSMNPLLQSSSYLTNGIPDGYLLSGGLGGGLLTQPSLSIKQEQESSNITHPLYRHGLCKWPGCDTQSEDFPSFIKHLNSEHQLDDRSTAQARVQMQVVSQLEIQLTREKELLQAMMQHLHMKPPSEKTDIILPILPKQQQHQQQQQQNQISLQQAQLALASQLPNIPMSNPVTLVTTPSAISMSPTTTSCTTAAVMSGTHQSPSPVHQSSQQQQASSSVGPIRRRVSDKCNLPISAGMQRDMENAFLSFVEIQRNREFYRTTDVRPPFTYASLIRQAIIESPHRQLTLNEIYQWFTNTFAYFRRNEATWKNAVRHNLSLHKCFMRVENVKGAVWTVDEVEFYKRRPQKMSGYEDDFGSFWMVDDFEFVRRRHLTRGRPRKYQESEAAAQNLSMKSPNLTQDPSLFGENLNASLRAALGDNNLSLIANGQLPSGPLDGVEDLSMKTHASHLENLSTEPISEEELLLSIKQEPPCETDHMTSSHSILRPSELPMLSSSAGEASLMNSDTAAMMGSNSDTQMLRQHQNDSSYLCSTTDMSSSLRSVDTPTMCPTSDSALMCPSNDTSMMVESSDIYPTSETSGTNDADNENCAVDFSMVVEEPATPPSMVPTDRLESNLRVPSTPSELVSHSSDA